jgi:hypothetical protein
MFDFLPDYKTKITAFVVATFNLLAMVGVVEPPPEVIEQINGLAIAAVGLFLWYKIHRGQQEGLR